VVLFETGHREEGLAKVREAVAAAKDPQDKANAEKLEMRLKSAKAVPVRPAGTNETRKAKSSP
jgi:hypothetical protein